MRLDRDRENAAMEPRLADRLDEVGSREHGVRADLASAVVWAVFAGVVGLSWSQPWVQFLAPATRITALILLALCTLLLVRRTLKRPERRITALRLEQRHPELDSALLAAVNLEPDLPGRKFGYLATRLHRELLDHARRHRWADLVSGRRIAVARAVHLAAAVCFALVLVRSVPVRKLVEPRQVAERAVVRSTAEVEVEPGDVEWERGRSLFFSARFSADVLPAEARVVFEGDGAPEPAAMTRSLEDPLFGTRLASVDTDLRYHIDWPFAQSRSFQVTVFEFPRLTRADIHLEFPEFTGLEPRLIEDTRRVTAVENTAATLICHLNKSGVSARLVDTENGDVLQLAVSADDPRTLRGTLVLERSHRRRVELEDEDGRREKSKIEFVFKVTPNRRPSLELTTRGDLRVSPLEEIALRAKAADDFGVERAGVGYQVGGEAPVEIELGARTLGKDACALEHTLALEALNAEASQLVSYYFWAEDRTSADRVRRTTSDLYFAEVRPFEEIFHQADAAPGGQSQANAPQDPSTQGGSGSPTTELLELQRSVLLATWKLQRTAEDAVETRSWEDDAEVIRASQEQALDRLGELSMGAAMSGDGSDDSGAGLETLQTAMTGAVDALARSIEESSLAPLPEAVRAEQTAYQALLKLQAHEFEVQRSEQNQQPGGQRSSANRSANARSSPSQQQLRELELRDDANRYETQSQAQQRPELAESGAQDAAQDLLRRLQELSRRQQDLAEEIRELEAELAAAHEADERAEAERRLRRLQEDQEQILRDADEMLQQMDDADPTSAVAQQRDRMEQSRQSAQRSSEALEEGQLSQAITESSRASRELEQLEQEMRDLAGESFRDRTQDLAQEARRIQERQQELTESLRSANQPSSRSLREETDRDQLQEDLRRQSQDVRNLMERTQDTVLDAEETEPLLAEELFDTLERARRDRLEESLETARRQVERGFTEDAQQAQEVATAGVESLQQGIERALDRVIGTGEEGLERAEGELAKLGAELRQEIAREQEPSDAPPNSESPGAPGSGGPGGRLDSAPLTGDDYREWSERLRGVEQMIDDPELSAEAARLRSRARGVRTELTRHSGEPNWDLVMENIAKPLEDLRRRVAEELARRRSGDALVPIDRDPVPPRFEEDVQRYYERLGREQ